MSTPVLARPADRQILTRADAENFPVASRILPRQVRGHLLAVYGVCRLADELGDSYDGDRLAALDWLDAEIDRAYDGTTADPTFRRLADTLADGVELPRQAFADLVEANRIDQRVHRYRTFDDLVGYCRYSAMPVGRLVLAVFGAATPERLAWSDQVCTALQLAEHWQDVREDAAAGRVYLPTEDLDRFGVGVDELRQPSASPALRTLLRFEVARARWWLADGEPLVRDLHGYARLAVAGYVAGGAAALDSIASVDFDVLAHTARPSRGRVVRHTASLLTRGRL